MGKQASEYEVHRNKSVRWWCTVVVNEETDPPIADAVTMHARGMCMHACRQAGYGLLGDTVTLDWIDVGTQIGVGIGGHKRL